MWVGRELGGGGHGEECWGPGWRGGGRLQELEALGQVALGARGGDGGRECFRWAPPAVRKSPQLAVFGSGPGPSAWVGVPGPPGEGAGLGLSNCRLDLR